MSEPMGLMIVQPLADRHGEADALLQDGADRADVDRLVRDAQVGVGEPGSRVDADSLVAAAPDEVEDVLAVEVPRGAHAARAEDAAVAVDQDVGMRWRPPRAPGTGRDTAAP